MNPRPALLQPVWPATVSELQLHPYRVRQRRQMLPSVLAWSWWSVAPGTRDTGSVLVPRRRSGCAAGTRCRMSPAPAAGSRRRFSGLRRPARCGQSRAITRRARPLRPRTVLRSRACPPHQKCGVRHPCCHSAKGQPIHDQYQERHEHGPSEAMCGTEGRDSRDTAAHKWCGDGAGTTMPDD
jgi:hypothetical protein